MIKKLTTIMLAAIFSFSMAAFAWAGELHWELVPTGPVTAGPSVTLEVHLVNGTGDTIHIRGYSFCLEYDEGELDWTTGAYTNTPEGDLFEMFGSAEDVPPNKVENFNAAILPTGTGYDLGAGESTLVGTFDFQVVAAMEWDGNVDITLYYRSDDCIMIGAVGGPCEKIIAGDGPDVGVAESNPDLVISKKSEEWIDEQAGTYKVHYTVVNQGGAAAGASSTTCLSIDGVNVASESCSDLGPGGSYEGTFAGPFTYSSPSDTIKVCADWGATCDGSGVVDEDDETNNCLENLWSSSPNLVVTAKEENWQDRDTYKVLYTVTNVGGLYEGTSRTCVTIDGVEMGRNLTPTLDPGESIQGVFGPFQYTSPEDTIVVCADCEDDITESIDTDNCLENQLIPDLVVTDKYEQWNKDGTYNVYYTKQNIGNAPCGSSITCVYIDGASEPIQSIYNPGLQPGESMDGVFESLVCSPDSDNVMVCADCENDIYEGEPGSTGETNNCMENTWDCYHRPDLIISGWSLIPLDTYPVTYDLYFTVKNIGSDDADVSTTKLISDANVTISTPALAAGASVTQEFSDIEEPNTALMICADSALDVDESIEGNNCTPDIWGSGGPKTYVDVRDGLGVPGSTDRVVQINLNNLDPASDKVKGVEIEIMDVDADNWLTISEAKACGRAEISGFTCSFSELGNGAVRVVLAGNATTIKKGTGPVITLKYRVSSGATPSSCIALDPVKVKVADSNGDNLQTLNDPGGFCFTSDSWGDVYPAATCGDGIVDIFDILEEIGFALDPSTALECQFVAGDVPTGTPPNCVQPNENIDILDILVVIEKALGINNCAESFNG